MKKVGLLILVLVFALGALGAGYAWWTQDLVITGTVDTGELTVGMQAGTNPAPVGGASMTIDGTSGTEITGHTGYFTALDVGIVNAYPGYSATATVYFTNLGTVPVKVTDVDFEKIGTGVFDLDNIEIGDWTLDLPGSTYDRHGTGLAALQALGSDTIVLDATQSATFVVPITFKDMDNSTMNQTGEFTLTVEAGQFNK
jgi:hypothetical protein